MYPYGFEIITGYTISYNSNFEIFNLDVSLLHFFVKKARKVFLMNALKKVVYFWHCVGAICDSFSLGVDFINILRASFFEQKCFEQLFSSYILAL